MNLFRSEEHAKRWPLYVATFDEYLAPVSEWLELFSHPIFRDRLHPEYLDHLADDLLSYQAAFRAAGKELPPPDRVISTVLFTDIVDSTRQASEEGDQAWIALLERHDQMVRDHIGTFGGREVKQTGDGFLAHFDSATRAIRCAAAISESAREIGLETRAGVHTGECEVRGDDLGGIGVHIGARIAALAGSGEVLVSRTVADAVIGSGLDLESRGAHSLKGVPGTWQLHAAFI